MCVYVFFSVVYEGEWERDLPNGHGTYTEYATGDVYEGALHVEFALFFAVVIMFLCLLFLGEWVDNQRHGHGKIVTKLGEGWFVVLLLSNFFILPPYV